MSLNFDSAHFQTSFPTWAGVFRVAVAAAVAPVDYVLAGMVAAGLGAEAISLISAWREQRSSNVWSSLVYRRRTIGRCGALAAEIPGALRMSSNSSPGGLPEFMFEASRSDLAAREVRFMRSGGGSAYPIVSASGLSIDLFPNWPLLPGTAACPSDNAAPVHHGVGASVNSLLPLATGLGSCVGEPVVVTGGALVLPVQESMLDVFEAAQSSKALSPAGVDHVEGEPQPSVEEASPPEYTASSCPSRKQE